MRPLIDMVIESGKGGAAVGNFGSSGLPSASGAEGEELKIQVPKSDAKSVDGNGDTEAAAECNEAEKRPGGSLQASVLRRR